MALSEEEQDDKDKDKHKSICSICDLQPSTHVALPSPSL